MSAIDGTIIRDKKYDKVNHFDLFIYEDGNENKMLTLNCKEVSVLYKKSSANVVAKFYYSSNTSHYFDGDKKFSIGTIHALKLILYNEDHSEYTSHAFVDYVVKEKCLTVDDYNVNPIYFEIVFSLE